MAKSDKKRGKQRRISVIGSRSSDVSGFEVYALDAEDDERRLATVFLRTKKRGHAEYCLYLAGDESVDPAATGTLKAEAEAWDDEERERLVREAVEASGVELPFVADDIEFLWDVEQDEADEDDADIEEEDLSEEGDE